MTHRDDAGNVQVDFVWGNMPMQPNDDRDTNLDPALDNHVIAVDGYSNFPGFIPNYAGDEDTGLEAVVPDILRKTRNEAKALLEAANLDWFENSHNLEIQAVESTGKTVRMYAYNESWNSWGGYESAALNGLRVGDEVALSVTYDGDPLLFPGNNKVTKINLDGTDSWFEFKVATALDPVLDVEVAASGTVIAGDNLLDVVTMQRSNHAAGSIKDEGFSVHFRYFAD